MLHNLWLDLKLKSGSVQIRPFFFFFLIGVIVAGCDGFMMYGFGLWTATCGKYRLNAFNGFGPDWMGLKGLSVGSAKCGFGLCCIFWLGHRRQNGQFMLMRLLDGAEKNIWWNMASLVLWCPNIGYKAKSYPYLKLRAKLLNHLEVRTLFLLWPFTGH